MAHGWDPNIYSSRRIARYPARWTIPPVSPRWRDASPVGTTLAEALSRRLRSLWSKTLQQTCGLIDQFCRRPIGQTPRGLPYLQQTWKWTTPCLVFGHTGPPKCRNQGSARVETYRAVTQEFRPQTKYCMTQSGMKGVRAARGSGGEMHVSKD